MEYFELNDDIYFSNRWYLGDVLGVDNWELPLSKPSGALNLQVEIAQDGSEMDFTFTEAYGVPIVSKRIADILSDVSSIELIPVSIIGKACEQVYFVLVTHKVIDCVDEDKSDCLKFIEDDPVRPDRAGEYRSFFKMMLDESKIDSTDIFRLKKYEIALIVSEKIRNLLGSVDFTGLRFSAVT